MRARLLLLAAFLCVAAQTIPPVPPTVPRRAVSPRMAAAFPAAAVVVNTNNPGLPVHYPVSSVAFRWPGDPLASQWHVRWGLTTNYGHDAFIAATNVTLTNVTNGTVLHFAVAGVTSFAAGMAEGWFSTDVVAVVPVNAVNAVSSNGVLDLRASVDAPGWLQMRKGNGAWTNLLFCVTNRVNEIKLTNPPSPSFYRLAR